MFFVGTAVPSDLTILTEVVDAYCLKHRMTESSERNEVAARVMHLFLRGVTDPKALAEGIDARLVATIYPFRSRA